MVQFARSVEDESSGDQECNGRPQPLSQGSCVVRGVHLDIVAEAHGVDSHGESILPPGIPISKWYHKDGLSVIFLDFLNIVSLKVERGVCPQSLVPLYCPCSVSQALETLV